MDVLGWLSKHPLFATFEAAALEEIAAVGIPRIYEPGEVCIAEGQGGEIFGVLVSGRLEAVRGRSGAAPEVVGSIQPGECFGEMSLLTGEPTRAEVIARERSEAVIFLQEAIGPRLAANREAVQYLTRLLARRLAPGRPVPRGEARPAPLPYSLGATRPLRLLSISCRRSDVRYGYFDTASDQAVVSGRITGLGGQEAVHVCRGPKGTWQKGVKPASHEAALEAVFQALRSEEGVIAGAAELSAVGHRVCHGGARYNGPVVIDEEVKAFIAGLAGLAPQDNPYNLRGILTCQRLAPKATHVAVFDTAFHQTLPPAAYRYALPRDLAADPHVRRFGFHGISHEGAARTAAAFLRTSVGSLRLVTCHLGVGASMAAIDHGRSVDTSMGFTPLEGLVMATRPGDLDPGLMLYLVEQSGLAPEKLADRLFNAAGLLGLSGLSEDVATVAEAAERGHGEAIVAIQVYCQRARKYLSGYIGLLGGVDAIVFTGGVGENNAGVRARICQGLDWMGVVLDEARNRAARVGPGQVCDIAQPQSRARVLVVGGDEEQTIARQTVRALSERYGTDLVRRQARPIPIGVSAHHVHLSQAHVEALFGPGHRLTSRSALSQPGQFACEEQVSLLGPKSRIDRVRVLGPVRPESQVEISRTEEYKLGIDAPVRLSGDLDGTPGLTLEGPAGQVTLARGVICAMRHIHMGPEDALEFAVRDGDRVRVRTSGERSVIFGDVVVRVHRDFRLEMHLDTDEANAAEISSGAVGWIDSIQSRA